jgi:A/G-specific adenine glycosylase
VAALKGFFTRFASSGLRSFPWREAAVTPFELLTAELLLVQTKAEDVARIWPTLIERYPSIQRLARARTHPLTRLLQPLGLQNQRARALKATSREIMARFDGDLPNSIPALLSIPHVGLYVACAVACFKYGQRVPIVDANVLRVFGRVMGIELGKELRRSPRVWHAAWGLLPEKNFALHNYGLLDFSAQVCRTKKPLCSSCPLIRNCAYGQETLPIYAHGQSRTGAKLAWTI